MILSNVFSNEAFCVPCVSKTKDALFAEMVERYAELHPDADKDALLAALNEREAKMSTGIAPGIAVPHCKVGCVKELSGIVGVSHDGVDYDAVDGQPVKLIFMIFSPLNENENYLRVLKRLATLLRMPVWTKQLLESKNQDDAFAVFEKREKDLMKV